MRFTLVGNNLDIDNDFLGKVANAAFSFFAETIGEIELEFVTEKKIKELNKVYRDKDIETDVLSFTIEKKPLIGQIFICYNIAKEQARQLNKPLQEEISLLLVHGMLHIYGYDHESDKDYIKMQEKEAEILESIGIRA